MNHSVYIGRAPHVIDLCKKNAMCVFAGICRREENVGLNKCKTLLISELINDAIFSISDIQDSLQECS